MLFRDKFDIIFIRNRIRKERKIYRKVLLYCAILSQNPVLLDECENLSLLKNTVPLEHKLVLNPFKRSGAPIYRQYNVLY